MKSFAGVYLTTFILISTFITNCNGCGCGGACGSYATPSLCGRCCTQLVKRSMYPSIYDDNANDGIISKILQPNANSNDNNNQKLRPLQSKKPHFVFIQKRDTCGCNMGCFYSAPMECARCCSHGVRRDVDPEQYPESDHYADVDNLETNESVSELQQLLNYIAVFGDNRRKNRND